MNDKTNQRAHLQFRTNKRYAATLEELTNRTDRTATKLINEALSLLFRRHRINVLTYREIYRKRKVKW